MKAKAYYRERDCAVFAPSKSTVGILTDPNGHQEFMAIPSDISPDWQPLLTAEEWQARHPTLRKLEEGEALKRESQYVMLSKEHRDRWSDANFNIGYTKRPDMDYYELPPLPPAEREPEEPELNRVPFKKVGTIRGKFTPAATPAPSPVGERLTVPKEGDVYVKFWDSGEFVVSRHEGWEEVTSNVRYYRWHGPIPTEPAPEKVEPPKWLGAVRPKFGSGAVWVTDLSDGEMSFVKSDGKVASIDLDHVSEVTTLAPDIMPPSPELAALFAKEGE